MSSTNFINQQTVIQSSWLNDVNNSVYSAIGNGTAAPTSPSQVKTNLGITPKGEYQTATTNQTLFNLSTIIYTPGSYNLFVFVNGSKQIPTLNYIETSTTSVTFLSGLNIGDIVEFLITVKV